jgi:hypothetical protein
MQVVKFAEINHLGSTTIVVLHQGLIIKPIRSEVDHKAMHAQLLGEVI